MVCVAFSSEKQGALTRNGLLRARGEREHLGRMTGELAMRDFEAHFNVFLRALDFPDLFKHGKDKTLSVLCQDLYENGCRSSQGKSLSAEMIRRMRANLTEAKEFLEQGPIIHDWLPGSAICNVINAH